MLLYIIRHGDPHYKTDTLTPRGRVQAEAVGKRIADSRIDRIFSSPMGRAYETAQPACRLLGLECNIEDWTHEIGSEKNTTFPDGVKKSITLVQNTYLRENGAIDIGYDDALTAPGFNETRMDEALKYIEENGNEFLERLGYKAENGVYRIIKPSEERVALFCHAAFTRAWLSILLHIPVHLMWSGFAYNHTGVTVLEFRNNANGLTAPKCLCYSDCSHLYASGLDLMYDNHIRI